MRGMRGIATGANRGQGRQGVSAPPASCWTVLRPTLWTGLYRLCCGIRGEEDPPGVENGTRSTKLADLEAVLFLAREPLGSRKLAVLSGLADGTEARTLVRALNRLYDGEGCAFRVVEVAGGFQLVSRAKFAPWLRRLHATPPEVRLSGPALETLAVVAYRQPVLRADIDAIRGVQCGEILRQLMERGLVRIVGKSEELGRPFLYGTTRLFLQVFGLRDLDELPRLEGHGAAARVAGTQPVGLQGAAAPSGMGNEPTHSNSPGEDSNVKTVIDNQLVWEDDMPAHAATLIERDSRLVAGPDEADDEELEEEDEDDDLEDDDLEDDDLEDEDFEDSDWEEVEEDEELEEEEEEDEELEEEEDEDWDDEDEDWDDEDEDWDDEDEEEEEQQQEGEEWE